MRRRSFLKWVAAKVPKRQKPLPVFTSIWYSYFFIKATEDMYRELAESHFAPNPTFKHILEREVDGVENENSCSSAE